MEIYEIKCAKRKLKTRKNEADNYKFQKVIFKNIIKKMEKNI
jgi:hypothetical protein